MKYCKNYRRIRDMRLITEVIIPPEQTYRLELYVMHLVFHFEGENLNIGIGLDGSMIVEACFYDDVKRQKFCETIEEAIDAGQPISASREELRELEINLEDAFSEFHAFMDEIQPLIQFIKESGGWLDEETAISQGIDNLKTEFINNTLPRDVLVALNVFGIFIGTYMVGRHSIENGHMDLRQKDTE